MPTAEKSLSNWSPESPGIESKAADWWALCCSVGEEEEQEEMSSSKTSESREKQAGPEDIESEGR